MRVAILGTFDLQNYGDLLFPLLARHELGKRLDDLEIVPFSYRSKDGSAWLYPVHPVDEFPRQLAEIDCVLVGGGHLVRFDAAVAPEYGPTAPGIHHPTGLWLVPPLLAAAAGRPVVWNGVGVSPDLEDWAVDLLRTTLEASVLVSVRDRASKATLLAVTDRIDVLVVPDSAFGVGDLLLDAQVDREFESWKDERGVVGPYVLVQPSPKLQNVLPYLLSELESLRASGFAIVEAPIGPVLGDRTGLLPAEWTDVVRLDPWPGPRLLAQIIAHAEAAVGVSLHLGITSLCHGVPIHRPRCWPGSKYEILGDFPGVVQFDEHGGEPHLQIHSRVGRGAVNQEVERQRCRLDRHWDEIAEALLTTPDASAREAVGRFFVSLPFGLIDAEVARRKARTVEGYLGEQIEKLNRRIEKETERHRVAAEKAAERIAREEQHRALLAERGEELERELSELASAVADLTSLQARTDAARGALARELTAIHASRAWRASLILRRLYLALTSPWRWLRAAWTRRADCPPDSPPSEP